MPAYPKRLIEVDLPIRRISDHARREKSIRHGHISTLHIWWARRPLAACRAVICASLWPDPADDLCPDSFRLAAREWMGKWSKEYLGKVSPQSYTRFIAIQKNPGKLDDNIELRSALLDFIADFANWDHSTIKEYLETSRALTQAAHEALGGAPGTRPLVVDPFAGGGSIPLEALRVGADAFASDLNSIPVLLNKVVLEYIPKYGQRLADEVRKWGGWIKQEAEKELSEFYPKDVDGSTPIAYLWARTIQCEGPGCGTEVPLMRSLWLAKRSNRSVAMQLVPRPEAKLVDFKIIVKEHDGWVNQDDPKEKISAPKFEGTVKRGSATCPCCGYTTPVARVRDQLCGRQGGASSAQLCAVVVTRKSEQGRFYRLSKPEDHKTVQRAKQRLVDSIPSGSIPDEILPLMSGVFNAPIYGHNTWASLFSPRQLLAMATFARLVTQSGQKIAATTELNCAIAVQTLLAFAVSKQADLGNALCAWEPIAQCPRHLFGRQAIGMVWDFAEGVSLSESSGGFSVFVDGLARALENVGSDWHVGTTIRASASSHPLPDDAAQCIFTDPPYYNAVPYADLSDFFYVWLKRSIGYQYPELFGQQLSAKDDEICEMAGWDPIRYPHKTGAWYEDRMRGAMSEARRVLAPNGVGVVVFAHKSTGGWEAQLQAMLQAGWVIAGSWPIDTENSSRLRAQGSAALASSVHLVCRPRENSDGSVSSDIIGDWRDVLQELPRRIHDWMPRLAAEGVVGADAIFACLGPALEIFSRYSRVEKASGEAVTLKEYLEHVWAAVEKEALNMIFEGADTSGFEEDARLTAMWLWTLVAGKTDSGETEEESEEEADEEESKPAKAPSGYVLEYDAARKIAQGLGAHLETLTSLVEVKGDKARLLPVAERARHLFGKEEEPSAKGKKKQQMDMFSLLGEEGTETQASAGTALRPGATVLDRLHQSMLLFAAGRSEGLKRFLVEEGVGRDARFWRLAQAFSALFPASSTEKRWVDGVLARKKGLGF